MPDTAYRDLTADEIRVYQEEGAALVPQCVDPVWIERMTNAIDRQLASPSVWVHDTNPGGNQERFLHDRYLWPTDTDFREFAFDSGVGELAAQAMGSKHRAHLFRPRVRQGTEYAGRVLLAPGPAVLAVQGGADLLGVAVPD